MLATLVNKPFDKAGWIFEVKWDGYRAIAEKKGTQIKLYSRNDLSFSERFPEVAESLRKIDHDVILDGEIVVLDKKGVPSFQMIQDHLKDRGGEVVYYVFDILELDGKNLMSTPLIERKKVLEKTLPRVAHLEYGDFVEGRGIDFFEAAKKRGLEGIMAKEAKSEYRQGERGDKWLKIKARKRQEAVIGGFTAPRESRKYFGSLLMGVFEKGKLNYIGHSGGGFSEEDLKTLYEKLRPLEIEESPFENTPGIGEPVTWVKPVLVGELEYTEWTKEGLMRQPVFLGLREDKIPGEVSKETGKKSIFFGKEPPGKKDHSVIVNIGGRRVKLTHLEKVFWPEEGYTKGDLIEYYRSVSSFILPYLKDRPLALLRSPEGILGESFYQKDMPDSTPEWVETKEIKSDSEGRSIRFVICQDEATLIYLVNLGSIDLHGWTSRVNSLDNPDHMILDLDPGETEFTDVIKTALAVKQVLDRAGISGFCKTSGIEGIHIYVPLGGKYTHDQAKELAYLIAVMTNDLLPEVTSIERSPEKRRGKVYLDYLQNGFGKNTAVPYCVRPVKGARISTPLEWREVRHGLVMDKFTIKTVPKRLQKMGDIFRGVLGEGIDMRKAVDRLQS